MQNKTITTRKADYPINEIFLKRWSARAMSGEEIKKEQLMSLFEAARWSPSSYNNQPWRFIYALKDTKHWNKFCNLLGEFNQSWAKNSSALVILISKKNFEHNNTFSKTHSFDSGASWMSLALQAQMNGLFTHAMEGFDYDQARKELKIPADYHIEVMIAIGKPGKKESLSIMLQEKESPSERKKISELVMES